MGAYLLRRLLIAIPSLLGISLILFTVLALAPGDPFGELATNPNVPPEVREALRLKFGLDDPILVRYLHWLTAMLHGDWGFSFASRVNVDELILQRLPTTLFVVGSSQVLALLVAVPVVVVVGDGDREPHPQPVAAVGGLDPTAPHHDRRVAVEHEPQRVADRHVRHVADRTVPEEVT